MSNKLQISRRRLLNAGAKGAFLTAAIGIAPKFIRPGRAYAADALGAGMIGGPTGFAGSERYQYSADTPEGRAIEAAKKLKASRC
jgi:multiple sugar transport system substrate-binding protein